MNNINNAFSKGKAFIPFITCGQISLDITEKTIYEMEKNGANLIELGIPFSDPVAEGSIIQSANNRALKNGTTTDKIFSMLARRYGINGRYLPIFILTKIRLHSMKYS